MARPHEYDFNLCLEICEQVAEGNNIVSVLNSSDKFPVWSTFRRWKRDNEELRTLYVNSQQDKAEALENEMDNYRDMLISKEIDAATYNTLVQTLKWKMSKFYPKMFGDKQETTHVFEKSIFNGINLDVPKDNSTK
jgi:hypothetical protein